MKKAVLLCGFVLLFGATGFARAQSSLIKDVPSPKVSSGHWAYRAIEFLERAGALIGFPGGAERQPAGPLTRRDFAVLTVRALDTAGTAAHSKPGVMDTLRRLVDEFEPELRALGRGPTGLPIIDVDAVKAYLAAQSAKNAEGTQTGKIGVAREGLAAGHWASAAMERLWQEGIFRGYPGR